MWAGVVGDRDIQGSQRQTTPIMENHTKENMDNGIEPGIIWGVRDYGCMNRRNRRLV